MTSGTNPRLKVARTVTPLFLWMMTRENHWRKRIPKQRLMEEAWIR